MKQTITLIILLNFGLLSCNQSQTKPELETVAKEAEESVETYYYVTQDAAKRFSLERKAQILYINDADTKDAAKFYLGKSTKLKIGTRQLTGYPILIKDIKNVEIDTADIENNILTVTPKDSIFQFSVYRDFSKRNAIFSRISYDSQKDSMIHKAFLMKNEMVEGILKFKTEKESNKTYE
jgi:hypothetical protein